MPLHDKSFKNDAEELLKIAKSYEQHYRHQKVVDDLQLNMINMNQSLTAPIDPATGTPVKFQSGIPGVIFRENAALFSGEPVAIVNAPKDDPVLLDEANDKLEPWIAGAIRRSQSVEPVFSRKAPDMLAIGRAWDFLAPKPGNWVNDEVKGWISQLREETDEDKRKELKKNIAMFRRDHWPFTYRHVDPRTAWFLPGGEVRLPLVIEVRKMKGKEIRTEYGENILDNAEKDEAEINIYPYANHFEAGILIAGKQPKIVKRFEHGLEMSPYGLMEAKLLPANDQGLRWAGLLFHAINLMPGLDQLLTDFMTYVHNYTLSPVGIFLDKDEYDEDARAGARPPEMELEPGGHYTFWQGEDVRPLFNPQMTNEHFQVLQFLHQLITQNHISATLRGEAKAGQSNNLFVTALETVQQKAEPYMQAIERDYESLAIRHMRGVISLNKDFEGDPDPVYVMNSVGGKKSYIGLKPKDITGWESAIQAVMSRASLVDFNVETLIAGQLTNLGVSREQVLEDRLGYPNPTRVIERGEDDQIRQGLFDVKLASIINLAGQRFATLTPQEEERLAELEANASPQVRGIVDSVLSGGQLQGQANQRRAGSFQNPQRDLGRV